MLYRCTHMATLGVKWLTVKHEEITRSCFENVFAKKHNQKYIETELSKTYSSMQ